RVGRKRPTRSNRQLGHVLGGRALLPLHDVEFDTLTLGERLVAVALNCGMMNEAVLLAAFARDEAKTLRIVEPLHGTSRTHCVTPKKIEHPTTVQNAKRACSQF